MTIKIYGDLGAGSFRRVAAAAKIMGVEIARMNVDLFKGESHTPAFLELNPHGADERYQVLQWIFWSGEQWRIFATLLFNERVAGRAVARPRMPQSSISRSGTSARRAAPPVR